jgi:hypothetical protein
MAGSTASMSNEESQRSPSRLTSPVAVKAAISECDQLGRGAFLRQYGFGEATEYVLEVEGGEYDSKAIAAVAFGYQYGEPPLAYDECHGGRGSGDAGWALNRLGFKVRGIKHVGWWLDEVERTVEAYFEMFAHHRAGRNFKKKDYLLQLHKDGPGRSYKAYEYKFQNISAVLRDMGREWLSGFAPKGQYQLLLRYVVEDRIGRPRAPQPDQSPRGALKNSAARLVKIDWAKRDAENRELGIGGERFIFETERLRLIAGNKPELAANVKWDASEADGHGYDVSSFELDGTPIQIEVKTTTGNGGTPFFISSNELQVSRKLGESYRLYRLFNFPASPDIAVYRGPLDECLALNPATYRAKPK